MMNQRIFNKILCYQSIPETFLSCCKKFTIERVYNFRWKNRIYFRDNRIKIKNCDHRKYFIGENKKYYYRSFIKEIWYKDGKLHNDSIDLETGFTLPTIVDEYGKYWYKNGDLHRDDVNPVTGLTFPARDQYSKKKWYKYGKLHRDEVNPKTGTPLPAYIDCGGYIMNVLWYNNGIRFFPEIDEHNNIIFILNSIDLHDP